MEAMDSNPAWTGVGASEVVRIEIISEEEYADLMRTRIRTEDFIARYRAALQAMQDLKKRLEEIQELCEADPSDTAALDKALEEFKDAHDRAHQLTDQLSRDFPAFAAETDFHQTLRELAKMLKEQTPQVKKLASNQADLSDTIDDLLRDLLRFEEPMNAQAETAEQIAEISRLFELSQYYLQLVRAQEQLARRLDRYPDPAQIRDPALYDSFRREETAIRERLLRFREQLVQRANDLPDDYGDLKQTALDFSEAMLTLQLSDVLEESIQAAERQDGRNMAQRVELALERMRQLLSECPGGFGGMMQCELRFRVRENMRATLKQMMSSWAGLAAGLGGGTGAIGDGYSESAHTPLNVPMYGPGRSDTFQRMTEGGHGRERGAVGGGIGDRARQVLRMESGAVDGREAPPMERAPERYRDALRRYFGGEE
jgi:hypothetical protein